MTLQAGIKVALLVQAMLYGCFGDEMDECVKVVQRHITPGVPSAECVRLLEDGSLKETVQSDLACPSLDSTQVVKDICELLEKATVASPAVIGSSSTTSSNSTAATADVNEANNTDERNSTVPATPVISDNNNNDNSNNNNNNKGNKTSTDADDKVQRLRYQTTTVLPLVSTPSASVPRAADLNLVMLALLSIALLARFP